MTDTTAPKLLGLTFPSVIDLNSGSSAALLFTVQAEDDVGGSGMQQVSIALDKGWNGNILPAGYESSFGFGNDPNDLNNPDNFMDSTPTTASVKIPLTNVSTNVGVYNILSVDLYDKAFNFIRYHTTQLQAMGINTNFSVINSAATVTTPVNHAPTIPTTPINLPNGTANTPYQVNEAQLLAGFFDSDGDQLSVEDVTFTNASVTKISDGWMLVPNAGAGVININYSVSDEKLNGMVNAPTLNINLTPSTIMNNPPSGLPVIEGVAKAGTVLSVSTMPIFDADGINASTFNFQWFVDNSPRATGSTYTVAAADTGRNITVKANYTDALGHNETVTSNNVIVQAAMNNPPTGNITIEGVAKAGATLSVNSTSLFDADGINNSTWRYEWFLDNSPVASGYNYTVTAVDAGKSITVKASYTDFAGNFETKMSNNVTVQAASTYSLFVDKPNVTEGDTLNLTVQSSAGFASPNEIVNLMVSGSATNTDVNGGYIPTSVNLDATGKGQMSLSFLKDNLTEGMENLTFTLANDSTKSVTININDAVNPPTYNLFADRTNVNEGDTITLGLQTTNVPAGTEVKFNFGGSISNADTTAGLNFPSFFVGADGTAKIAVTFTNDKLTEGVENLMVTLPNDPNRNVNINVNDTSIKPMNNLPAGNVMINGDPKIGQTLFANTVNVQDMDGLGVMNYQWMSDGAIINGQTQQNYTLVQENANKNISVQVSYTDGLGNFEKVPLSPPVFVQQIKPTYFLNVDKFNVNEGDTANVILQTTNVPAGTAVNFNASGNVTPMDMASGSIPNTFFVDANGMAKLPLTFAKDTLKEGSENLILTLLNDPTKSVTINVNDLMSGNNPSTGNVMINGDAKVGQTLFANTANVQDMDGLGVMNYQWLSNGAIINGRTGQNYTLVQEDANKNISVQVSYTDGLGNFEKVPPSPTLFVQSSVVQPTKPTYSLSVDRMDVNEGESVYFKIATTNVPLESNINFPITFSGSITGADVDKDMLLPKSVWIGKDGTGTIAVSFLNDKLTEGRENLTATLINDSNQSVAVNVQDTSVQTTIKNNPPTGSVTTSSDGGNVTVGTILIAQNTLKDADGMGAVSYQWLKNGTPISGATQENYMLTQSDLGKTISVTASYTDKLKNFESVTSDTTPLVELSTPTYNLTANKTELDEGATVTFKLETTNLPVKSVVDFNFGGEISDDDITGGLPESQFVIDANGNASLSLAFAKDKTTEGSEDLTLTLADDSTQTASITVNDTSIEAVLNHKPTGNVAIIGTAKVGSTLSLTNTLKDDDGLGELNYQWLRDGVAIKNATQETYVIAKTDVGKNISVNVSYIDGLDNAESKTSSETTAIKASIIINGITKIGDAGNNKIIGADKNDDLSGLAGADTLLGYAGNDLLDGGNGNDSLDGGNGNDELYAGDGNDKLLGGSGNDLLDAAKGNDTITGDLGNDTLNGGAGIDNMTGGDGNDYYFVDNAKDVVVETNKNAKIGGNDTVESTSSYILGANIENLILKDDQGKGNSGTGNAGDNTITGSIGDNDLKGMAGNDKLIGGKGADTLDGGLGMDTLIGGDDDDTYYMNNLQDKIIETKTGGEQDQIIASVNFDLSTSPNVEMLTLSGAKAITGTGDEFNNLLQEIDGGKIANGFDGGAGDDTINGEGGNDTLEGGEGNDVLDGGTGIDVAIFSAAQADYQITPNVDAEGVDQILVEYVGNDEVNDGIDILTNIETLLFADGETLNARDVTDSSAMVILTGVIS